MIGRWTETSLIFCQTGTYNARISGTGCIMQEGAQKSFRFYPVYVM